MVKQSQPSFQQSQIVIQVTTFGMVCIMSYTVELPLVESEFGSLVNCCLVRDHDH